MISNQKLKAGLPRMIPFVGRIDEAEQAVWIKQLSALLPEETIVAFCLLSDAEKSQCDVAIVANPDPQELMQLPNLKWAHSVWAGVDRMVDELTMMPFTIVRLVDPELAKTMSEAVLAWTMYLHRGMPFYRQQQQEKIWYQRAMVMPQDRRVGVLGLGELGQVSAARLVDNGFRVSGWSRTAKILEGIRCYCGDEGLEALLRDSDILICLLPLTDRTRGLLNYERLALLPSGAMVINFARGPIVDEMTLLEHLDNGHLDHAVLDVFAQEPLPASHSFWSHPKVTVLPHISAPTNPTSASQIVAKAIRLYRANGFIPEGINTSLGY
ncbi:2-hydroxyacid dehydrogenase [Marinomonas spartinae]|nr:glyoxylate/hydroxypyruvate reductase A [Marinomonas spartinae]